MKLITWLKSLFTKREKEKMSDQSVTDTASEQPVAAQPEVAQPAVAETAQPATDADSVAAVSAAVAKGEPKYYLGEDVDKAFKVYFTALEHFTLEEAKKVFEFVKTEILQPVTK